MKQKIRDIAAQLESVYPKDEAESLAWWIAEELSGLSRTQLQFGCKDTTFLANTQTIIDRLLHFEPIQYIFGHTLWCGLDLKVTPATLIPRPETAELVEKISTHPLIHSSIHPFRVLDIGTGSGCIAIALKKRHPEWQVTGIDISPEAIEVARENAKRNGVEVEFLVADILGTKEENPFNFLILTERLFQFSTFNLIVSNPPYICNKEKKDMRPNVLDYEPPTALFVPDDDPLLFYRRIAELFAQTSNIKHQTSQHLFFEINEAYPAEVAAMLGNLGYTDIHITHDIYGKPRIIEARCPYPAPTERGDMV